MDVTPAAFSGSKLRSVRLGRGLTQAELAHRAHLRERQIIRWENNQHTPRAAALGALARALNVRVDELFADDEQTEEDDPDADWPATLDELLRRRIRDLVRQELRTRH